MSLLVPASVGSHNPRPTLRQQRIPHTLAVVLLREHKITTVHPSPFPDVRHVWEVLLAWICPLVCVGTSNQ